MEATQGLTRLSYLWWQSQLRHGTPQRSTLRTFKLFSISGLLSFFILFEAKAFFLALSKNDIPKSYFGTATCSPAPPISPSVSKSLSVSLKRLKRLKRRRKKALAFSSCVGSSFSSVSFNAMLGHDFLCRLNNWGVQHNRMKINGIPVLICGFNLEML